MATFTSIFVPGKDASYTVTTATASGAKTLGNRALFAINATGDINIVFFNANNPITPTASNFRIPAGIVATYDLADFYDSYAVFNAGASTITVWTQILSRS